MVSERDRIRKKVHSISPNRWRADEFDVRYYLITQLKKIFNKSVLDIGGGIGIVCSEMDKSNFKIVMDIEFNDLIKCKRHKDASINPICASFTNLPFKSNFFEIINCSHIIELTKYIDAKNIQKKSVQLEKYPTVEKFLLEVHRVLKNGGTVYMTTPNNSYFKGNKLYYNELKTFVSKVFDEYKISFYNTYPKFSKNRKLDMTNILPKVKSKFVNPDKIIQKLLKEKSENNFSKYFYCVLKKV